MLNMTQINFIRDLAKSGYRISEIHELTKADPKTITKYLEKDDFSPEPPVKIGRSSIVAPFHARIMEYLEEDKKHWTSSAIQRSESLNGLEMRRDTRVATMRFRSMSRNCVRRRRRPVRRNWFGNLAARKWISERQISTRIPTVYAGSI